MNNRHLLVLDEINEQGKVIFSKIYDALKHEYKQDDFSKIINELSRSELIKFDKDKLYIDITSRGVNKLIRLKEQKADFEYSQRQNYLKEKFELDNLLLVNENLKYSKTIRNKDANISQLTIKNLKLQNRQLKWNVLFIILGFILGFISSNLTLLLKILGIEI